MGFGRLAAMFSRACTFRRAVIFDEINDERWAQLQKWGEQSHADKAPPVSDRLFYEMEADTFKRINDADDERFGWDTILLEEVYEALAEESTWRLRAELVQSAAVIVAWIEDIDSRE